ncbi:PAS domain-containing protein [Deinococcus navajonensis]|uniref:histidine kinase n=1 Tax=Deinococcus navajonensis TaxID=309884 RepID=A0ABV8XM04_9DEIO
MTERLQFSLATRIMLAVALLVLLLGIAVTFTVMRGFLDAQRHAASIASSGVEHQIEQRLAALTVKEAGLSEARLLQAAAATRVTARTWETLLQNSAAPGRPDLLRTASGASYDGTPTRQADVWLRRGMALNAEAQRDVQDSQPLNALLLPLVQETPDTAALYFLSRHNVVRYAPPIGLHQRLPANLDITRQPIYTRAQPTTREERRTVWSPPYLDDVGHGLLVTASTPVYLRGEFRGIIGADVSLTQLSAHLSAMKPTPGGFVVLLDGQGRVIAAPQQALNVLLGQAAPRTVKARLSLSLFHHPASALKPLQDDLTQRQGGVRLLQAHGTPFLLSHAPLQALGWTLIMLSPRDEIAAQYASVARAITRDADQTLGWTVTVLLACFLLGLMAAERLAQAGIIQPISRLTRASMQVTSGNLDVRLPDQRQDEFGILSQTFNTMLATLQQHGRALQRSQDQYELAVRGSNDGLWEWNVAGKEVYYSPRWKGMLGYGPDDLEGHIVTWERLLHPDDRERVLRQIAHHLEGPGDLLEFECRLRHKGGTYRWIHSRAATQRDAQGRAVRLAGSHTDITERVEALHLLEQRVAARTSDLEALLSVTRGLTYSADLQDNLDRLAQGVVQATGAVAATVMLTDATGRPSAGGQAGSPDQMATIAQAAGRTSEPPGPLGGIAAQETSPTAPSPASWTRNSAISVPLTYGDRQLGMLHAAYPAGHALDDAERQLLMGIAGQAAVVVENARLFASARNHAALEERQKLARDLHDSVSQALYGIALGGRTTLRQLERTPEKAPESVRYMLSLAEAALAEMRALIFELRPESLEQEGLSMALAKLASALQARHSLAVSLDLCEEPELAIDTKVALLRIAQEATHNTVKHAGASSVEIHLNGFPDRVELVVQDDGTGFDPSQPREGSLGQKTMRERAQAVGATCTVSSEPGQGTVVRVTVPST